VYLNVGTSVLVLLGFSIAGAKAGEDDKASASVELWPSGLFGLAVGIVFLFLWAGVRLQYARVLAEQVSIKARAIGPETFGPRGFSQGQQEWTQHLLVENDGPPGTIRASLGTQVYGIAMSGYGKGVVIAWEQSAENGRHLNSGESANLRLLSSYAEPGGNDVLTQFWLPPPHTGHDYGIGNEQTAPGREIKFELDFIHVERNIVRRFGITVEFDAMAKPDTVVWPGPHPDLL
jgi:hypothetical protein